MSNLVNGRATYFDGLHASATEVPVDVRSEGVAITFPDRSTAFWSREEITTTPRTADGPAGLLLVHDGPERTGAMLVIEDVRLVRSWRRFERRPTGAGRPVFERGDGTFLASLLVLGFSLFLLIEIRNLRPAALEPLSADRRIGDFSLHQVAVRGHFEADTPRVKALERMLETLTARLEKPRGFDYHLTLLTDTKQVNAFALPGGQVIVTQGILAITPSAEALAGVLAHEIQHVEHRHGTTSVLQTLMLVLFMQLSGLGGHDLGHVAQELAGNAYTRELEAEADREGVALLLRAAIDPAPLVTLFELMDKRSGGHPALSWLGDHPTTVSRISAIRQQMSQPHAPFRSLDLGLSWQQIQSARTAQP